MDETSREILMRAKENSIGPTKKEILKIKRKKVSKQILTVAITLCLLVGACGCQQNSKDDSQYISYQAVTIYEGRTATRLEIMFKENGLRYGPAVNDVEDYRRIIQYLSEEDMITYYDILGSFETNKICSAHGYTDLNDFLVKNEYVDEYGNPSLEKLRRESEIRMTQEMLEEKNGGAKCR